MKSSSYLACDLGAESGRVMLGTLADGRLELKELHRFPNQPVKLAGSTRWDLLGTFRELKQGLRQAAGLGLEITSLSVDSWGVDYVWSGAGQPMLAPPHIYRDERVDAAYAAVLKQVSPELIFAETGIQFMAINTLYQLFDDHQRSPGLVRLADRFLTIADYFHFLFSGVAKVEVSLASTTQIYNPVTRTWSKQLIEKLGYRAEVFPELVDSGTTLGVLSPEVAEEAGLTSLKVVASCSHDTGAAVAAVPTEGGEDWAYLSSGTWSLMGVELPAPLMTPACREANFTNEQGFGGTTRLLKNIVGLWILQECRREWERQGQIYTYDELTRLAREAASLQSLIHPDDPRFLKPGDMPAKIEAYCRETGQAVPESVGATVRCILESLALLYRETLITLENLTGRTVRRLHIVGGGSKNALLNQFAANATGRQVLAGPVEATAFGNLLIQAIAAGHLDSLAGLRKVVRQSAKIEPFQPKEADLWQEATGRFEQLGRQPQFDRTS